MKGKDLLIFLCLLLVVSAFPQDQSKVIGEGVELKAVIEDDDLMVYPQVTAGDKPGIQALTCYVTDADFGVMQMLKLNENESIYFFIEYTALFNTNVAFHYIWSGPEFFTYSTDTYAAKYKNYYYLYIETNNNWKKGTYTLTVVAENKSAKSGSDVLGSCRVRFY
jgi:hypothetical protein